MCYEKRTRRESFFCCQTTLTAPEKRATPQTLASPDVEKGRRPVLTLPFHERSEVLWLSSKQSLGLRVSELAP